jgi:hypothetical protein
LTPELVAVRERLLAWAKDGTVEFRYSGTHICEISPLNTQYLDASEARAEMLIALCGNKTLVSLDVLLALEIRALSSKSGPTQNVYSNNGDWFPPISNIVTPVSMVETINRVKEVAHESGMSRKDRRALMRKTFKRNSLREDTKDYLISQRKDALKEILSVYPMRDKDALIISNYIFWQGNS